MKIYEINFYFSVDNILRMFLYINKIKNISIIIKLNIFAKKYKKL